MTSEPKAKVCLYLGEALGSYHFGESHPFGPMRLPAFVAEAESCGLISRTSVLPPCIAKQSDIERFHGHAYVERVKAMSESGDGFLDNGDTPAFKGMYETTASVAGSVLDAVKRLMQGEFRRAFIPIAGLHHASRDQASGFCVFNDCGIAIESLLGTYGLKSIGYIDIDAHHGNGVLYAFNEDPRVVIADIHEDGHYLYPGTGFSNEQGLGKAIGTKLNIPMPAGANDELFLEAWGQVEALIREHKPQFLLFQCGADSLAGDPLTHMRYSEAAHAHVRIPTHPAAYSALNRPPIPV